MASRSSSVLVRLLCALCTLYSIFALPIDSHAQKMPEVKVWLQGNNVSIAPRTSTTASFIVQIPPDHHGYLDHGDEGYLIPCRFSFTQLEKHGVHITLVSRPAGERDDAVRATVLRGTGEFVFRFDMQEVTFPNPSVVTATLQSQICNDVTNLCYAPLEIPFPIQLARTSSAETVSPISSLSSAPSAPTASLTWNEWVTSLFRRYGTNLLFACGLIFAAGLLAVATPCVYPMLPLTSAFLMARGQGSTWQGSLHVLFYGCGIIFFYMLLGLLAATTGTALSSIMTSAWTNLGFALLFVYFGLSMVGFYEFQFFAATLTKLDTTSSLVRGFPGSFCMGTMVGLIVSPCVGPVTATILLDITQQTASISTLGEPINLAKLSRGIVMMASFGAGLAVPFLSVGTLSYRLPQLGTWLTRIKFFLGIAILYFAYTYYMKGMETAGIASNITHALLVGMLAIIGGVFIGAFHTFGDKPSASMLLRRAIGIILLVIGIHFLYNGIGESGLLIQSRALAKGRIAARTYPEKMVLSNAPNEAVEVHGNLHWLRDFSLAQQRSRREQKPLFVDFYATWCANCKAFQHLSLKSAPLNQALHNVILVKIYDTDPVFADFQKAPHYPELRGVGGQPLLPLFAIYSPHGTLTWKGQDYQAVNTMVAQLTYAQNGTTP